MQSCRICLSDYHDLAYATQHVAICAHCVEELNSHPEPANLAEARLGDLLRTGMGKRNPHYTESEYQRALPGWLNRLLANKKNNRREFKIVRANRRGLLRADGPRKWNYPADWIERARRIRSRDRCCQDCGANGVPLDVHHIVFLSNYGTNRQENLASLCRPCHEKVHGREFDFGETEEPGNPNPIRPTNTRGQAPGPQAGAFGATDLHDKWGTSSHPAESRPSDEPRIVFVANEAGQEKNAPPVDLWCPQCRTALTAKLTTAALDSQRTRCPACQYVFTVSEGLERGSIKPRYAPPLPAPESPAFQKAKQQELLRKRAEDEQARRSEREARKLDEKRRLAFEAGKLTGRAVNPLWKFFMWYVVISTGLGLVMLFPDLMTGKLDAIPGAMIIGGVFWWFVKKLRNSR